MRLHIFNLNDISSYRSGEGLDGLRPDFIAGARHAAVHAPLHPSPSLIRCHETESTNRRAPHCTRRKAFGVESTGGGREGGREKGIRGGSELMDTVSTFVEDEDDDGAPETYYYSSEGRE